MAAAHSHDGFEETNYGLAGVTTFTVDGEQRELHPGQVVFIPRGAVHAFENRHDAAARFLAVVTPGLLGPAYFHEIAAVLADGAGGPPDRAAIGEVMRRHGLTPAVRPAANQVRGDDLSRRRTRPRDAGPRAPQHPRGCPGERSARRARPRRPRPRRPRGRRRNRTEFGRARSHEPVDRS